MRKIDVDVKFQKLSPEQIIQREEYKKKYLEIVKKKAEIQKELNELDTLYIRSVSTKFYGDKVIFQSGIYKSDRIGHIIKIWVDDDGNFLFDIKDTDGQFHHQVKEDKTITLMYEWGERK